MRPSGASQPGGFRRARSDCRMGSRGATHGAATATAASSSTKTPPATTNLWVRWRSRGSATAAAASGSAGTDAGIEDAIDHVYDEIEHDEHRRRQEDARLHHRIIAVVDRLDRQPSDARPGEH